MGYWDTALYLDCIAIDMYSTCSLLFIVLVCIGHLWESLKITYCNFFISAISIPITEHACLFLILILFPIQMKVVNYVTNEPFSNYPIIITMLFTTNQIHQLLCSLCKVSNSQDITYSNKKPLHNWSMIALG